MRLLIVLLGVLVAGAVQAETVKARLTFSGPGFDGMAQDAKHGLVSTVGGQLQQTLAKQLKLLDFDIGMTKSGIHVTVRGEWSENGIPQTAAEDMRKAALEAAAAAPGAKLALTDFRIEIDDGPRREVEVEMKRQRQEEESNREKARPQPRLEIDVKEKLIESLTILDVPLVRAMDRLGSAMPVAYVLHPNVVGRPVYVRLIGVTMDEALAAIAESAQVKIEKREKYIAFVPLTPTK